MSRLARQFQDFCADEAAAITIDWVALTSALLLMGIMVVYSVFDGGVSSLVDEINQALESTGADIAPDPVSENTGNASSRACTVTASYTVCMGPK